MNNIVISTGAQKYITEHQSRFSDPADKQKVAELYAKGAVLDNNPALLSDREAQALYEQIENQKTINEQKEEAFDSWFLVKVERLLLKNIDETVGQADLVAKNFTISPNTSVLYDNKDIAEKIKTLKTKFGIDIELTLLGTKKTKGTAWDLFSSFIYKNAFFIDLNGAIYPSEEPRRGQKLHFYVREGLGGVKELDTVLQNILDNLK